MAYPNLGPVRLMATVDEVLPLTGLAYLTADDAGSWTVTKSTPGIGLDNLKPGTRLELDIERQRGFAIVRQYRLQ